MAARLPAPLPELLVAFGLPAEARARRPTSGLINETHVVELADARHVVAQRISAVFDPRPEAGLGLLGEIDAITAHVAARGLDTPRLLRRPGGELGWRDDQGRLWRIMTFVPGETIDRVDHPRRAAAAATLVARWHEATAELHERFTGPWFRLRPGAHDAPAHLRRLAVAQPEDDATRALAAAILATPLPARSPQPAIPAHGDLKISNLIFAADDQARALIDLDTVALLPLADELGDALRSWCNPAGEDAALPRFEREIFDAALAAYAAHRDPAGYRHDPDALRAGTATVALELASRFALDAVEDRYFGWDPARFPSRRAHNLARGWNQLRLHRLVLGGVP
jgi:hypothetical protein